MSHTAGLNLYQYCGNNPLNRVDPMGLDFRELTGTERDRVLKQISNIHDYGFEKEAAQLHGMVKAGRINIQNGDNEQVRHWLFGTVLVDDTLAITRGSTTSLSESNFSSLSDFGLQSLLVHELVHINQNQGFSAGGVGRVIAFVGGLGWERDAYAKERRFLNSLLW